MIGPICKVRTRVGMLSVPVREEAGVEECSSSSQIAQVLIHLSVKVHHLLLKYQRLEQCAHHQSESRIRKELTEPSSHFIRLK